MFVQSKASTLSSGARAAAQTLNVPIERLEAQVHMTQNNKIPAINEKHVHTHRDRDRIDSHDDDHIEYNGNQQDEIVMHNQDDEHQMDNSPSVMKYSLLQFAMQHFRNE
ncbi:hypothetical protein Bhyg_15490 [Pseudolycoriella hygida]|uniref:Uncharacterized protein n=1 Tax=Pseudolycoriella hygida TaxID=35572 RepID=A0A9Q0MKJ9_9DIPT|nr:hypothetical protein Bhyg_15490 [Pseudolycoriella hygida]